MTGIRGSLKSAADIKRNESGVVDAITAEDIGKFPDANLAESLQRITGVSIDRQDNEGNQISVRGLGPSFNLVTLNGRQMPNSASPEAEDINSFEQSRAFNFAEISSDSVSGVNVFKTARPDLTSGGLGATVDVLTARPFDYDAGDAEIVASVAGIRDFSSEVGDSVTPEVGGLFSYNFNDVIGFTISGSFSERNFRNFQDRTEGFDVNEAGQAEFEGFINAGLFNEGDTEVLFTPRTFASIISDNNRERINGQAVFQVRPVENFTITADYVGSRFDVDQTRFQTALFNDLNGAVTDNGRINSLSFDENGALTFIDFSFGPDRAIDTIANANTLAIENDSVGLNLNWELDKVSLELDLHESSSVSQPDAQSNDTVAILQGPLGVNLMVDLNGDRPEFIFGDPSTIFRGDGQFGGGNPLPVTDPFDQDGFAPLVSVQRVISIDNTIRQAQFRGSWRGDDAEFLTSIDFGAGYAEYDVATSSTDSGVVFQQLNSCLGVCDGASGFLGEQIPLDGQFFPVINPFDAFDAINDQNVFPVATVPPALSFVDLVEESLSFYLNSHWETEFNGWPAELSAGVRFETTDVLAESNNTFVNGITVTNSVAANVINSTTLNPLSEENSYSNFLPALDFNIRPNDEVVLRFSYGRTLARPSLSALRPGVQPGDTRPNGPFGAFQGNPELLPFLSDNIDLAFEWYYGDGSYLGVTYFHKDIQNFIGLSETPMPLFDEFGAAVTDPSARFIPPTTPTANDGSGAVSSLPTDPVALFDVVQAQNTTSGQIDGVEIALQHIIGESGFGFQTNYTFVDSPQAFDIFSVDQVEQSLQGLSDTANIVVFYESESFEVRVAANWRDEFLVSTNQLRVINEPVFVDEFVQVDASASYTFSDNVSVFLEGLNLTGEDQFQTGRFDNQFLFADQQEPRLTFGVRLNF